MSRNSITTFDKKRLLDAAVQGQDFAVLAKQLQINMSTARHNIQRARKRNGVVSLVRGGANNVKIDTEIKHEVQTMLDSNCQMTLKQIKEKSEINLPSPFSFQCIKRV